MSEQAPTQRREEEPMSYVEDIDKARAMAENSKKDEQVIANIKRLSKIALSSGNAITDEGKIRRDVLPSKTGFGESGVLRGREQRATLQRLDHIAGGGSAEDMTWDSEGNAVFKDYKGWVEVDYSTSDLQAVSRHSRDSADKAAEVAAELHDISKS